MRMLASIRLIALAILTAFAIAACHGKAEHAMVDSASSSSSALTDCQMIQHEMGETEVCGQPQRIVVLGPYVLEPLLTLDVQPVAFADHEAFHQRDYTDPSKQIPYLGERITQSLANVGTAYTPSLEAIVKVQPDLILGMEAGNAAQYETLSKIAPTLLLDYFDPEGTLRAIAKAVNRSERVEQLIAQKQQQIARSRQTFAPLVATHPQVLLLGSSQLQAVQLESGFCSSLIEELGFERVSSLGLNNTNPNPSRSISLETLPQFNDTDLVILFGKNFSELKQLNGTDRFEEHQLSKLKQAWEENAIAQSLDASKAGRVYFIPAYICRGLPGSIGTELYLEELKQQLLSSS